MSTTGRARHVSGGITAERAAESPPRPRRVLLVDDDDLLREVARTALEAVAGWQVSTARSSAEAQALARQERPDAIVLDVMMPGTDGPSTLSALRRDPATRDIAVLFLTAKLPRGASPWWLVPGASGVITKPFDPMTLARQIATLLAWDEGSW